MSLVLHEHPFAAYCWKALIALYELELPFERALVEGEEGRERLADVWPPATMPVLVDDGFVVPESSTVVEYLDSLGPAPRLIPTAPAGALQARLWDRVVDGHVMTPMQKIVGDALRPENRGDPEGVAEAREALGAIYEVLDGQLAGHDWLAGPTFTVADCAAAPALFYGRIVHRWDERRLAGLTGYYARLVARPSVARVIDEAREYRPLFPLPWPDWADSVGAEPSGD